MKRRKRKRPASDVIDDDTPELEYRWLRTWIWARRTFCRSGEHRSSIREEENRKKGRRGGFMVFVGAAISVFFGAAKRCVRLFFLMTWDYMGL